MNPSDEHGDVAAVAWLFGVSSLVVVLLWLAYEAGVMA